MGLAGGRSLRLGIGIVFLLAQAFAIGYEHLGPTRYFSWAPNDYAVEYSLQVKVVGQALTVSEIASRYGRAARRVSTDFASQPGFKSLYENPPQQLIDELSQYEESYGRNDHAQVILRYRLDGHAIQVWQWPKR